MKKDIRMNSWFYFYILYIQSKLGKKENCNPEMSRGIYEKSDKGRREEMKREGEVG